MAKQFPFGIEDVLTNLGLSSLFSSATMLEPQGFSPAVTQSLANAMGNFGDILVDGSNLQAVTPYDKKQTFSVTFCVNADNQTGVTVILGGAGCTMLSSSIYNSAVAGGQNYGIYGKFVLTGVSMPMPAAGFGKITLTGHAHYYADTGSLPSTFTHVAQKYTIALPNFGWGIQQLPFCLTGSSQFTLADFENYSFSAEVQHTDETNRSGEFLIGASHGAKLSENITLVNSNSGTFGSGQQGQLPVLATNWHYPNDSRAPSNTGYEKRTIPAEKFQAHD